MPEPLSSGAAGAYAAVNSTWLLKLIAIPAGIFGTVMMIALRPNLTRKQMVWHCVVASVFAISGTGPVMQVLNGFGWVTLKNWPIDDVMAMAALVGLIIGGLSWGFVGGLYWFSEKFGTNPIEAIQEWRNMRSGGASVMGAMRVSLAPKSPITAGGPAGTGNEGKFD